MDKLVVGFDGSPPSFVAVDWAAQRAARGGTEVEIVMVHPAVLVIDDVEELDLGEAEGRIRDIVPGAIVTSRTVVGKMPDALIDAAADADLFVIGTHRNRPIRSALTGWRPLRTVSQSNVPTVTVPEDWTLTGGRVLVGVDDDDSSGAAIDFAADEARAQGVGLTMLHAWAMPVPSLDGPSALVASRTDTRTAHARILAAAHEHVTTTHPELDVEAVLTEDSPTSALLAIAPRCSLLVLGTHHRGLLAGAFLGSVGQDALVGAPIPVCVVPADGSVADEGEGE